ncbi:MAG: ribose-phosphate diphosphokinase [Promethearchaeota archaeon]
MEKIVIIGPASQLLGVKVAKELNVKAYQCDFKTFPDGEVYLRIDVKEDDELKGKEVIIIQSTGASSFGDQNKHIFELFNIISAAKRMGAGKVRVVIPYLAYARQDKVFRPGECLFAQTLLKMIETLGADELFVIDIHAPEALKVLNIPAHNLDPMKYLAEYIKENMNIKDPIVVSPDKGAVERSKAFAKHFGENVQVEVFSKHRDVVTGEIEMTGELKVKDKDVIIADDIIATGGTMASAIKISKKSGARSVYAVGTHPLLIKNAVTRIMDAGTDVIIGTDTIDNPVPFVSMAKLIAENLK